MKTVTSERVVAVVLAAFSVAAFVRIVLFVFTVGLPFGYYKDLGVNYIVLSYATHDIHSVRDFVDALAWAPWFDQPLFNLNPYLSYLVALPVTYLFGNAWFSIKVVEALQFVAAFASVAWLSRLLGLRSLWAAGAGLCYALLPATALAVRGNLDIGWTTVGAPLALASGIVLVRQRSEYALPLAGAICSILGFCIGVEYLVFVSVPIYVILVSWSFRRRHVFRWACLSALGLLVLGAVGAYFVLPSLFDSMYSDSAARVSQLNTDSILPLFSETWDEVVGFVPRESVVSPVAAYNALQNLWIAQIGGCVLLLGAIGALVVRYRRGLHARWAWPLIDALLLVYLMLGPNVPLGSQIWYTLGLLPMLDAIRTPDRFLLVPAMFAVVAGFKGFSFLEAAPRKWRFAAPIAVIAVLATFTAFDVLEHTYQNQNTIGTAEPDVYAANDVVRKLGARTVSLALVNGGSPLDYPSYGIPVDTVAAVGDWTSRYIEDGTAGAGLMQRAGARSVVATPMWASADADDFPDAAAILRTSRAQTVVYESPQGVVVARVPRPRGMVSPTHVVCLQGGPGLLDQLLDVPQLSSTSMQFATDRCTARSDLLSNYDPLDSFSIRNAVASIAGNSLFSSATLKDADYHFAGNRVLLKDPWYRNSVDGDALIFDPAGAALITKPTSGAAQFSVTKGGNYTLLIREAAHEIGTLNVSLDGRLVEVLPLRPRLGMHWLRIPFDDVLAGAHTVVTRVVVAPQVVDQNERWDGVAIDGAAVVPSELLARLAAIAMPRSSLAMSLDRLGSPSGGALTVLLAPAAGGLPPESASNVLLENVGGARAYQATTSAAQLTYPWHGKPGLYFIRAIARLSHAGDAVTVAVVRPNGSVSAARTEGAISSGRVSVGFSVHLYAGDRIQIALDSLAPSAGESAVLLSASVRQAADGMYLAPRTSASAHAILQFSGSPTTDAPAIDGLSSVSFSPTGLTGGAGSRIAFPITSDRTLRSLDLALTLTGSGTVRAVLNCGTLHVSRLFIASGDLALHGDLHDCSARVTWVEGFLSLASAQADATYASLNGSFKAWIPAGVYVPLVRSFEGTSLSTSFIAIGGSQQMKGGLLSFRTSGYERVGLKGAPPDAYLLLLIRRGWPAPAATVRLSYSPTGALRGVIALNGASDVEVTHLNDNNWILRTAKGTLPGFRCDLLNTCFAGVPAGKYELMHRYPRSLTWGLVSSLLALLIAGGVTFAGNRSELLP